MAGWGHQEGPQKEQRKCLAGSPPQGPQVSPWQHYRGWLQVGKLRPRALRPPPRGRAAPWGGSRAPPDAQDPLGRECPHSSILGAQAGNTRWDRAGSNPQPHGTGQSPTPTPATPGGSQRSLRGLRTQPALLHSCSLRCLRQRPRSETTGCRETHQPPGEVNTDTEGRPSAAKGQLPLQKNEKASSLLGVVFWGPSCNAGWLPITGVGFSTQPGMPRGPSRPGGDGRGRQGGAHPQHLCPGPAGWKHLLDSEKGDVYVHTAI